MGACFHRVWINSLFQTQKFSVVTNEIKHSGGGTLEIGYASFLY
jgi:hypothetical protein